MKPVRNRYFSIIAFTASITACGTSSDPTRFYSMNPNTDTLWQTVTGERYSLAIASVRIPRLIDRSQIVSRRGKHEIIRSEFHQWGGSIQEEIENILAESVEQSLESGRVQILPSNLKNRPGLELFITIRQLDGTLGETVSLDLDWQLVSRLDSNGKINGSSRLSQKLNGSDYETYIAGLSELLKLSASEIAREIEDHLD